LDSFEAEGSADVIKISNPDSVAPPIGSYSHLAVVPAGTDLLYLAGQVDMMPDGNVPDNASDQFVQAIRNILAILASEGCGPEHIIKLNTFLVEPLDLEKIKGFRADMLGDAKPPSTLVYVPKLATPDFLVEIEAIAARPAR
jgi:2-iminobutanoate/2-iminopropanoate deaminase